MSRDKVLEQYGDVRGVHYSNFVDLFRTMRAEDPECSIYDLDLMVKHLTGLDLVDLLEEREVLLLLPMLSDDPETADAIFEGLGSFP
jgi:hypothetical protein